MIDEKTTADAVTLQGLGPDVTEYLSRLVDEARAVLGANLIAAYAAGSIGLGDYLPGRSDVDIALICEEPLLLQAKHALVTALRHESIPCPARGLELVVYQRVVAQSGTPEPGFEVELNSGPSMAFRATYDGNDCSREDGRFWYALDRSILHQGAYRFFGPPAAEMFAELSLVNLRSQLIEALSWWMALPAPTKNGPVDGRENAVLGACRALVKFRYGVWLSKAKAGRRLLQEGDLSVIEQALASRDGGAAPTTVEARAFQQGVLREISGCQQDLGECHS